VALRIVEPLRIAAVDAGSNAIRLIVAHATGAGDWETVETSRLPIRLGHHAFSGGGGRLNRRTLSEAVAGFREFQSHMERMGVVVYRAVATSAAREARNREQLKEMVRRRAGIELEIISGDEEARLVRVAVARAFAGHATPRVILDFGGGSLEINWMRGAEVERVATLPLGAVRLMEAFRAAGAIREERAAEIVRHVEHVLASGLGDRRPPAVRLLVACGGNAEFLARVAAGASHNGFPTLNMYVLRARLWQILHLDADERKRAFHVRRDRAEVMGVAALVLLTVGRWLRARSFVIPGVGVREGLLTEISQTMFAPRGPLVARETAGGRKRRK
jgi:exopolyphosphatase / guanosine-5'-triphosphate,3'-diphosphate pyrophosphatase